jgi:hypothetical protein
MTTTNQSTAKEQVFKILDDHLQSNNEELDESKKKFADSILSDINDQALFYGDRCKILQGRQEIIEAIKNAVERVI